jgi:hypothetical protein
MALRDESQFPLLCPSERKVASSRSASVNVPRSLQNRFGIPSHPTAWWGIVKGGRVQEVLGELCGREYVVGGFNVAK